MFQEYLPLALLLFFALAIGLAFPLMSRFIGPHKPKQIKTMPYESGMDPVGSARERFSVKFYLVAMLFIVFDIEVIFMYPWAVQYKQLAADFGLFPLLEMGVFVLILFVGYLYLRKKGAFKWE